MRAIITNGHGGLDEVSFGELPVPEIGPDEVLVKLRSAALNRLDFWVLEGWRGLRLDFPHILGCDGAGLIVRAGNQVSGYVEGDRVAINPTRSCGYCSYCRAGDDHMCDDFAIFGEHIPGFYAEYQAVPARNLLKLPDDVSYAAAAAASLVYVTAWHSLIAAGGLKAGEDVLVVGAAGGVNSACIDIARLAGARRIFVLGSNERKLDVARRLGAHFTFSSQEENWSKRLYEETNRQGVDIVVDNVGADTFQQSLRALKKGGRLLTVGNSSGPVFNFDNRYIFGKHLSIIGTTMGPIAEYEEVMGLVFSGLLNPVIDSVFPLEDGTKALKRLQDGEAAGKIVLQI